MLGVSIVFPGSTGNIDFLARITSLFLDLCSPESGANGRSKREEDRRDGNEVDECRDGAKSAQA